MGRSSVVVDIQTVRLVVDDVGICTESIEHRLSDVPTRAIGTVQTNLHTLEGIDTQRDQVTHIAVAACNVVHRAADMLTVSERQLRPVLIEHMEFTVNVILD